MNNKPLFKDALQQIGSKTKQKETQQQTNKTNIAKGIAIGLFGILAIPIILKIYLKDTNYLGLIIGIYWTIIIGGGLFALGAYIKYNFFKSKPKEQKTLDPWNKI